MNENVLLARKIDVFTVPAFTLPVVIGSNNYDRDITTRSKVNRFA